MPLPGPQSFLSVQLVSHWPQILHQLQPVRHQQLHSSGLQGHRAIGNSLHSSFLDLIKVKRKVHITGFH